MSPRAIVIAVLAMSGSFSLILAVLGLLLDADAPPPRARRPAARVVAPPPTASIQARPVLEGQVRDDIPDVPDEPAQTPEGGTAPPPEREPVVSPAEVQQLARTTQRHLQGVEDALAQQVKALRQSRDLMLDELATQLAGMTVEEAAATLEPVDVETTALTLKRLPAPRRSALLRAMPADRRTKVERLLQ